MVADCSDVYDNKSTYFAEYKADPIQKEENTTSPPSNSTKKKCLSHLQKFLYKVKKYSCYFLLAATSNDVAQDFSYRQIGTIRGIYNCTIQEKLELAGNTVRQDRQKVGCLA